MNEQEGTGEASGTSGCVNRSAICTVDGKKIKVGSLFAQ